MPAPRYRHRWADKLSPRTWCLGCGCDRTVTQPADLKTLAAGDHRLLWHPKLTRSGDEYGVVQAMKYGHRSKRGTCDRAWPENWIPENAPAGYCTPGGDIVEKA
jgi:hypothetical protein